MAKLDKYSHEMEKIYMLSSTKKINSELKRCFREWRLLAAQDFIKRKPSLTNTVYKAGIK